ncbi:MAG: bifunctional [glutamate--ammonia ligase]-adenylyl-L-tyrosine phosphorylase/[glutamate--ammonia-ligase] adenylyltransferase, partial [Proteobacteria bacterium]
LGGLIRAVARRSVYLSLLAENPSALQRLIDLYHASPWIARAITQQPMLLDELLDPRVLFTPSGREQLITHLNQLLGAHDPNDAERLMDTLRDFKNQQVLRVAASDIMHHFPVAEVSDQLSDIAGALLHHALHAAARILLDKHGEPRRSNAADSPRIGFAIIAYGKLGGFELGYGSDLDLVFIHDSDSDPQMTDGAWPIDNNVYFIRLTKRVIHFLTTRTAAGRAYEIDTRLRPSGQSGLLVSTITAFAEYQKSSALTWEHQALVRARAIAGTPETMAAFERLRRETLMRPRDAAQLRREIVAMRERLRAEHDRSDSTTFDLKYGVGGITDIEFMVQYGVLRWAPEHHDLLAFTDNLRLLDGFTRLGLMATAVGTVLHNAYFTYRAEVHRCALQETATLVEDTQFRHHRKVVDNAWREMFGPQ